MSNTSIYYTNVGTDPPTNVAAMQVGLTGFTVSWTPPNTTPTGYVVFFQGGDDEGSVMVDSGSATVVTVDGRLNNRQYSITMVALSLDLPSTVTSSETVMLCKVYGCSLLDTTMSIRYRQCMYIALSPATLQSTMFGRSTIILNDVYQCPW